MGFTCGMFIVIAFAAGLAIGINLWRIPDDETENVDNEP